MNESDLSLEDTLTKLEATRNGRGVQWVQLARTPCLGKCPVYSIRADKFGTVDYRGLMHVALLGQHQGSINRGYFFGLVEFIDAVGFWEFDEYCKNYEMMTDLPSFEVTVNSTQETKRVISYGPSGPCFLWALAGLIDLAFHETTWRPSSH